jgi:hypothetical protein
MGVLVIGGEQTFSGAVLRNSPLEEIVPVQMPMMNRGFDTEDFLPALTEAGRSHFISAQREGASFDWGTLPPLSGNRTTLAQLAECFAHRDDPGRPAGFD